MTRRDTCENRPAAVICGHAAHGRDGSDPYAADAMTPDDRYDIAKERHDAAHHLAVRLGWNASQFDEAAAGMERHAETDRRRRLRIPTDARPSEPIDPPAADDGADPFPLPF